MKTRRIVLNHLSVTGTMTGVEESAVAPMTIRNLIKERLRAQLMTTNPRIDVDFKEVRPGVIEGKLVVLVDVE